MLEEYNICASLDSIVFKPFEKGKENALVCKVEGIYLASKGCKIKDGYKHEVHPTKIDKIFSLTPEQVSRICDQGAYLVEKGGEFFLADIAFGRIFRIEKLNERR